MATASTDIEDFLAGPLIAWLRSCLQESEKLVDYSSLWDGSIIFSVLLQIDPEPAHSVSKLNGSNEMIVATRINNFNNIFKNLKTLYDEEFRQTIVSVPDFIELGTKPDSKLGLENMKLLILLLLGAAVQCPNRKTFIQNIYDLNVTVQHAIKDYITQVIESQTLVLTNEYDETINPPIVQRQSLMNLIKERDKYFSYYMNSILVESFNSIDKTLSPSKNGLHGIDNNHHAVELADWKAKLRRQRQELEEKSEVIMECKEELEYTQKKLEKLKVESQEWFQASCRVSAYRDEIDALREKCEHADRLEQEVQKLRDRINDDEFYKNRVEELREDNKNLSETIEMLEEQLSRARKRSEQALSLETEIIKYKQRVNDLVLQKEADHSKLQDLIEENTQLQLLTKSTVCDSSNSNSTLNHRDVENDHSITETSLIDQLKTDAEARVLKLELENKQLLSRIDDMLMLSNEASNNLVDSEKERKKLALKCIQLKENCDRLSEQNAEIEKMFKNSMDENKKLLNELDNNKFLLDKINNEKEVEKKKFLETEKQLDTLMKEKLGVLHNLECLQRKYDELEKLLLLKTNECDEMLEKVKSSEYKQEVIIKQNEKITNIEKENQRMIKDVQKLRDLVEEKEVLLDKNSIYIEEINKEIERLTKELKSSQEVSMQVEEMKKKIQDNETQSKMTDEIITTLQANLVAEKLNFEKASIVVDKLGLDMGNVLKTDNSLEYCIENILTNADNRDIVKEIIFKINKENSLKLCDTCNKCSENKLKISCSLNDKQNNEIYEQTTTTELSLLKTVNGQIRKENAVYKVDVTTLNSQISSLQNQQIVLQKENTELLAQREEIKKELQRSNKENKTIATDLETLKNLHEQLSLEYEQLTKERESTRSMIRDLKTENRDFVDKLSNNEKEMKNLIDENSNLKLEIQSIIDLKSEHSNLKDDFKHLFTASDKLKAEYRNLQEQYRRVRSESHRQKLQYTELTGELNNRRDLITSLQLELHKVSQYCEMLLQRNSCLDSDRRILMDQVSKLLSQYHELLAHSIEDNKHYHDEEKLFTDKVNNLCRQKEKLEEKIMEHYRKLESCSSKRKAFGSILVHRVCKAGSDLMKKVPSRNRHSWTDDSHVINSTLQSEGGDKCDGNSESNVANQSLDTQSSLDESLCLGSAGTRRTVYLTQENESGRQSPLPGNSTPSQGNTFIVYNKMIGRPESVNKDDTLSKSGDSKELKDSAI